VWVALNETEFAGVYSKKLLVQNMSTSKANPGYFWDDSILVMPNFGNALAHIQRVATFREQHFMFVHLSTS
jgi:hypothetical protein